MCFNFPDYIYNQTSVSTSLPHPSLRRIFQPFLLSSVPLQIHKSHTPPPIPLFSSIAVLNSSANTFCSAINRAISLCNTAISGTDCSFDGAEWAGLEKLRFHTEVKEQDIVHNTVQVAIPKRIWRRLRRVKSDIGIVFEVLVFKSKRTVEIIAVMS